LRAVGCTLLLLDAVPLQRGAALLGEACKVSVWFLCGVHEGVARRADAAHQVAHGRLGLAVTSAIITRDVEPRCELWAMRCVDEDVDATAVLVAVEAAWRRSTTRHGVRDGVRIGMEVGRMMLLHRSAEALLLRPHGFFFWMGDMKNGSKEFSVELFPASMGLSEYCRNDTGSSLKNGSLVCTSLLLRYFRKR
jgi:hypothetical protein